jgi:hypothetical protein
LSDNFGTSCKDMSRDIFPELYKIFLKKPGKLLSLFVIGSAISPGITWVKYFNRHSSFNYIVLFGFLVNRR